MSGLRSARRLAPFACDPAESRGRLVAEPESPTRTAFQRDRDRIVHSTAFRRLKYKTQVFVYHEGDHYRTRLTHSLEVSQIARALGRSLCLDEDLAEAIALAHDLGHPPFGHAGERALDRAMRPFGGFDHNAQSLAVVTRLERRYAGFDGLNLSWETLEGLVKHNGPMRQRCGNRPGNKAATQVPDEIAAYDRRHDLELSGHAGAEAQCAAIADDIAYNTHDFDDGLRAGLFSLEEVAAEVPFVAALLDEVRGLHPDLETTRTIHEITRRLITRMVEAVLEETCRRVDELRPASADEVRGADAPLVAFTPPMHEAMSALGGFLFERMYRHERVMRTMRAAETVVSDLFAALTDGGDLPEEWRPAGPADARAQARTVADYIAGMTDRYALAEHRRLFDATPELR